MALQRIVPVHFRGRASEVFHRVAPPSPHLGGGVEAAENHDAGAPELLELFRGQHGTAAPKSTVTRPNGAAVSNSASVQSD